MLASSPQLQRALQTLSVLGILVEHRMISVGDETALLPEELEAFASSVIKVRRASGCADSRQNAVAAFWATTTSHSEIGIPLAHLAERNCRIISARYRNRSRGNCYATPLFVLESIPSPQNRLIPLYLATVAPLRGSRNG
jgi:hypothetical protein